jgi:hypothetical protein
MHSSVSLPKKCCSIWVSGHGYRPVSQEELSVSMATRGRSEIKHNGLLDVFHLSMAGLANVTTEMGIIYKMFEKLKLKIKYPLLSPDIVERLHHRSTEYATLTWLVQKIYRDKSDKSDKSHKCQESMVRSKLEELKKEMLVLEKLADIRYTKDSLPIIIENPHFNKVYSLKPNPGENIRRDSKHPSGGRVRSGYARFGGEAQHNKVWAFYGLYLLDTSDPEHEGFSISNLPVDKHGFVDPREIIKKNLLTRENYTNWKHYLDARDFSRVPDSHVSDIGDDLQASVAIFKKFCEYTGIVYSVRGRKFALTHPIIAEHIETLRGNVTLATEIITNAIRLLHESASKVSDARAEFKRAAVFFDKAEEKYNALSSRAKNTATTTRLFTQFSQPATSREYKSAEDELTEANAALEEAKRIDTLASENAQQVENRVSEDIIAAIKKCIDNIISSSSSEQHTELKKILKNIIMSNKLKNILKTAIFYKKISLKQIILFFSGLEYQELGIADPACFVAKPQQNPLDADKIMQFDTQELDDSSFTPPPLFQDILDFIKKKIYPPIASPKRMRSSAASRSSSSNKRRRSSVASVDNHWSGGTKRKRRTRIYSRKRHTRRKRYTRRRAS